MVGVAEGGRGEEGVELVGGEVMENSEGGERTLMGELTGMALARLAGSIEEVGGANMEAAVFSMVGCI